MLVFLQWAVACIGVAAVVMAVRFIRFFSKSNHHIATSMVMMLFEQVATSVGTLLFAANSLWSTITDEPPALWNNISPWVAITIRAVMFGAMVHSTWRLSNSVRQILESERDGHSRSGLG